MVTRDYRFDSVNIGVENKEGKKNDWTNMCIRQVIYNEPKLHWTYII